MKQFKKLFNKNIRNSLIYLEYIFRRYIFSNVPYCRGTWRSYLRNYKYSYWLGSLLVGRGFIPIKNYQNQILGYAKTTHTIELTIQEIKDTLLFI